jgi:hypothetical protein
MTFVITVSWVMVDTAPSLAAVLRMVAREVTWVVPHRVTGGRNSHIARRGGRVDVGKGSYGPIEA